MKTLTLRGFMECVLALSEGERKFGVAYALSRMTGLKPSEVNKLLDKLDFDFVRVSWTKKGEAESLEILKTDLSELAEQQLKKMPVQSLNQQAKPSQLKLPSIKECVGCQKVKEIYARGKCCSCYFKERYKSVSIKACLGCGKTKKIFCQGKCAACYQKQRQKIANCISCNREMRLVAKNKCKTCYNKERQSEPLIQPT